MKKTRFNKFMFALVLFIISVFIGLGLLLGQLFKTYYVKSFYEQVDKEGKLIVNQIENNGGINSVNVKELEKIQNLAHVHITILTTDGNILYDIGKYAEKYDKKDNVFRNILNDIGKDETGTKYIGNGLDLFYYWDTIHGDDGFDSIFILTTQLDELTSAYKQLWLLLLCIFSLALMAVLFIGSRITTSFTKPVKSATLTAIELAKGNFHVRTNEYPNHEFNVLNASLNTLAGNLQRITKEQEMQNDRLKTVIENIGTPLILIDDQGYVILINQMYKELFRVKESNILGHTYLEAIRHDEVKQIIEDIFMTEQKISKEITIPIHIQMKNLEVYGAPIISLDNEWKGIVLVFHDITELKKLEKIRKDFVANVSHELKTPITSIKGFTETLLDGALYDEKALQSFLKIILKESNRIQSLVHDLLELSRIEQDDMKLHLQTVEINKIIHDIVDSLSKRAEDKKINIEIIEEVPLTVEGDILRLQQIFINIISNALSYTLPSGRIKINIQDGNEFVLVSVRDTGIGIKKEEIPRIFERFYRVDKDRSRNSGGTGLGLAIVRHSVEAHHGEIYVESELGKGSNFIVKLWKKIPMHY